MESKKAKIKKWWTENKDRIKKGGVRIGYLTLGTGVGYYLGNKICETKTGYGIERAYFNGIIKFFDPETNLEVGADEVIDVMKRHMK